MYFKKNPYPVIMDMSKLIKLVRNYFLREKNNEVFVPSLRGKGTTFTEHLPVKSYH